MPDPKQLPPGDHDHPRQPANMGDIARAAGVSISTVSRALRGADGVSAEVKQKIAALAHDMAYEGRGIASAPMQVFALVSMEAFASDAAGFYREIIEAIEPEMDADGIPLSTIFLKQDADNVGRVKELCDSDRPVGLLLVGLDDPDLLDAASRRAEIVLVNGSDPRMILDGITPANKRGAYLATRHLIDLGHRRIAHVTSLRRSTIRDRLEGYRLALADADISFDPDLVIDLPNLWPDDAYTGMRAALENGPIGATAIFCGNDMVATGVISALTEAGHNVPGDVSVIGFDNTRITARHRPGLTTVAVDLVEVGRQSARRLIARMRSDGLPALDIRVGCRLIERESTQHLSPGAAA